MKKVPFLIFLAVITIAATICVILDYKINIVISFFISFIFSIAMTIWTTDDKKHQSKLLVEDDHKKTSVGEIILGVGMGMGTLFAVCGGFLCGSLICALLFFLGSVLGTIVGLFYEH